MSRKKMFSAAYLALVAGFVAGALLCRSCYGGEVVMTISEPEASETLGTASFEIAPIEIPQPEEPICRERGYIVPDKGPINSLWRIAEQELGSGYLYPYLAIASGIENPDLIYPGQTIIIPCLTPEEMSNPPVIRRPARPVVYTERETFAETVPAEVEEPVVVPAEPEPTPVPIETSEELPVSDEPIPVAGEEAEETNESQDALPPLARDINLGTMVTTPGSMWNSLGTTPLESGNQVNHFHANQGIILTRLPGRLQVGPYLALNASKDTQNHLWNNRIKGEAGIKLARPFAHGVVDATVSYAIESRRGSGGETRSGIGWSSSGWFGWAQPTRSSAGDLFSSFPGSAQWITGNISPFEEGNVIGIARFEQGAMLLKLKDVSFVPTMWIQTGTDSTGEPWNNRFIHGSGLKMAVPWNTGTVNLVAGYECAGTYRGNIPGTSSSACGPTARIDFWTGWNRKGGF